MLWRLIGKLMFKATLPLVALAGVVTYGTYMRGGDPAAFWKSAAGKAGDQAVSLFSGVKSDASKAVGVVGQAVGTDQAATSNTVVFTWKDAQGVTHYGTTAPEGVVAQTLHVDSNVNVLAPVRAPTNRQLDVQTSESGNSNGRGGQVAQHRTSSADNELAAELGGSLPGVAGQVLSTQDTNGASQGDLDPAQLIRLLQSAGK